jgi:hypothetical protein
LKQIVIFSFFLTIFLQTSSQTYYPFVDTGKIWSTYHDYCKSKWYIFSEYTKFEGDTIIDSNPYKLVWTSTDSNYSSWSIDAFIREDVQKKVFLRYQYSSWELMIYDFGAAVGDTFLLQIDSAAYVMDSISWVTLLDGTQRRQYFVHTDSFYPCSETWIEGIGSLRGVLGGGTCGFVGDDPKLICFTEYDTLKYHNPNFEECYVVTGTRESNADNDIKLFPNPANGLLNVFFNKPIQRDLVLEIFGIAGNKLLSITINYQKTTIPLNPAIFTPGSYFYRILSEGYTVKAGKLVVLGE